MDAVKWAVLAVVAFVLWGWMKNGPSATTTMQVQPGQGRWGTGMVYAPSGAYQGNPYAYPQAYAFGQRPSVWQQFPVTAGYSSDGGFSVGWNQ